MRLNNNSQTVVAEGEVSSKSATISASKQEKLFYILTNAIYSDAQSAVIVELCNNGVDSIIESGKDPIKNPVIVTITNDKLVIEDHGVGMSKEFFENVFMNILESTKEEDDNQIGAWGLGGKSWASLKKSVTFDCVKDGKRNKFLCFVGESFIDYESLIDNVDTTAENGVRFEMPLNYGESWDFQQKAKKKLAYYDTVILNIGGSVWQNKIYRNELFQYPTNVPFPDMHICLKDVVYTLDWDKLGVPRINIPIALRFGLTDGINPTPSRESFFYTKESIAIIKKKISEVADYLVDKFNQQVSSFKTFKEALPHIDSQSKNVVLTANTLRIDDIVSWAKNKPDNPKVAGIEQRHLSRLKSQHRNLTHIWSCVGRFNHGALRTRGAQYYSFYNTHEHDEIVVCTQQPVGKLRDYISEHHPNCLIFVNYHGKRLLWRKNHLGQVRYAQEDQAMCYWHVLGLKDVPRKDWRSLIQGAQVIEKEYESRIKDYRNFNIPQAWLDARKVKYQGKSKALNKEDDEVTYLWARPREVGSGWTFENAKRKVSELKGQKYLSVYFTRKEKETARIIAEAFNLLKKKDYRVVIMNELEIKHVKDLTNFKSYKEFMETKVFARWATAMKCKEVMALYEELKQCLGFEELFDEVVEKHREDYRKFKDYYETYHKSVPKELGGEIILIAEEHNIFDHEVMAYVNKVGKMLKEFEFIRYLKLPEPVNTYYTSLQEKRAAQIVAFKKVFYQILLFNKLYYGTFGEFEVVRKEVEEEVEEEVTV